MQFRDRRGLLLAVRFNPHPTSEVGCNDLWRKSIQEHGMVSILTQPVRLGAMYKAPTNCIKLIDVSILTQPVRLGAMKGGTQRPPRKFAFQSSPNQ